VRSFARESAETAKFVSMAEATSALSKQAASARGVFMGGLSAAANASLVAVLYFGGSLVARGDMTVSTTTTTTTAAIRPFSLVCFQPVAT
jgi:ABC-type multidrug transport system fused ATPase/permease subunit